MCIHTNIYKRLEKIEPTLKFVIAGVAITGGFYFFIIFYFSTIFLFSIYNQEKL